MADLLDFIDVVVFIELFGERLFTSSSLKVAIRFLLLHPNPWGTAYAEDEYYRIRKFIEQ